jgi:hypothetical protein
MLKETEILTAVKDKLNTLYPSYPVYSEERKENYKVPCFFLKMISLTSGETAYVNYNDVSVYITYIPVHGASAMGTYEMKDSLKDAFRNGIKVSDRYLKFKNISSDTVGTDNDMLQLTLPVQYYDSVPMSEPEYKMVNLHQTIKG